MNVHYRATLGVEQENPRTMKRYKEVGTCDGTSLEETLYTYEKFLCERRGPRCYGRTLGGSSKTAWVKHHSFV